ncbi:MAG TPA: lipopolysaccharide biosynthesis protein [Thermoanaerobaculia bacterium]|nr:lipopolysaccharide biosynthesis protein [Thermoanaerobaculia bacterium]
MTQQRHSIGRATARAAIWAFSSATGAKAVTLIGLALLARMLAPHEFGLLAFAMAYITYAETIGDLGSGVALIYWPDRRDDAAQVTFITSVITGIGWMVITILLAPYVAAFFKAPAGEPIVRALAWTFLIRYLGRTHDALAQKDMRFGARAVPELALAAVKAVVAIGFAYFGYGAWSLVWGQLAGQTIWTIALWVIVPWRPSLTLPLDLFRPMLAYGRGITAVNILNAIVADADLTIVGRYLGITMLGIYQMASKIPDTMVIVALWAASQVLFPAFSKLHAAGDGRLQNAYLMASRYVSAVTVPASLGMFFLAKPIMLACFGKQWVSGAPILALLALYVGFGSLSNHVGNALKATGRASLLAGLAVIKACLMVPSLIVAAHYSAAAVAGTLAGVSAVTTIMMLVAGSRILLIPLTRTAKAFAPTFAAGAVMSLALALWQPGNLILDVLYGAAVYVVALQLIDPQIVRWVVENLLRRHAAPAPAQ